MNKFQFFNTLFIVCMIFGIKLVGSEIKNQHAVLDTQLNGTHFENYRLKEPTKKKALNCSSKQWVCGERCMHKREYCKVNFQCHPDYPIPCGDETRCYRQVYIGYSNLLFIIKVHVGRKYINKHSHETGPADFLEGLSR